MSKTTRAACSNEGPQVKTLIIDTSHSEQVSVRDALTGKMAIALYAGHPSREAAIGWAVLQLMGA